MVIEYMGSNIKLELLSFKTQAYHFDHQWPYSERQASIPIVFVVGINK